MSLNFLSFSAGVFTAGGDVIAAAVNQLQMVDHKVGRPKLFLSAGLSAQQDKGHIERALHIVFSLLLLLLALAGQSIFHLFYYPPFKLSLFNQSSADKLSGRKRKTSEQYNLFPFITSQQLQNINENFCIYKTNDLAYIITKNI